MPSAVTISRGDELPKVCLLAGGSIGGLAWGRVVAFLAHACAYSSEKPCDLASHKPCHTSHTRSACRDEADTW